MIRFPPRTFLTLCWVVLGDVSWVANCALGLFFLICICPGRTGLASSTGHPFLAGLAVYACRALVVASLALATFLTCCAPLVSGPHDLTFQTIFACGDRIFVVVEHTSSARNTFPAVRRPGFAGTARGTLPFRIRICGELSYFAVVTLRRGILVMVCPASLARLALTRALRAVPAWSTVTTRAQCTPFARELALDTGFARGCRASVVVCFSCNRYYMHNYTIATEYCERAKSRTCRTRGAQDLFPAFLARAARFARSFGGLVGVGLP